MREQDWGLDSKYCYVPGTGEQEEDDPPKKPD